MKASIVLEFILHQYKQKIENSDEYKYSQNMLSLYLIHISGPVIGFCKPDVGK
jgi:hypothetical protein